MQIISVRIERYRSLKSVNLEGLGELVVLVGANGSGKSNLLEALELFFADLNLQSDSGKQFESSTWYDKRTGPPIDFEVAISLSPSDLAKIFDAEAKKLLSDDELPQEQALLRIHRQIATNLWRNVETELKGYFRIKEGKILPNGRGSSSGEAFGAELSNLVFTKLHALLKNQFKLIRGPRESPERPAPTSRPTIIDPETRSRLLSLANSVIRDEEDLWAQLDVEFQAFCGRPLHVRGQSLEFKSGNLILPIDSSGSGDQALLIILRQFLDAPALVAVEEPETRLHHDYQRRFFEYLRSRDGKQQIFLATHSPVFIDRALLRDTWLFRKRDKESLASRLDTDGLRPVLLELGIRPSDVFLANAVLLVEGQSEKFSLPTIAEKLGIDLSDISIVPIHGKGKGNYHLSVWLEAARNTNLGIFLMLDGDAETELKSAITHHLIDKDHAYLLARRDFPKDEKPEFEDFLPKRALQEAVGEIMASMSTAGSATQPQEVRFSEGESVGPILDGLFDGKPPKPPSLPRQRSCLRPWRI